MLRRAVAALLAIHCRPLEAASALLRQSLDAPGTTLAPSLVDGASKTIQRPLLESSDVEKFTSSNDIDGPHVPVYAYPSALALITCIIVFIYGSRGVTVVMSVMFYLMALSSMKLSVKWVFVKYAFGFPRFVTCCHFICSGLVCLAVHLWLRSQRGSAQIVVPTAAEFFFQVCPIAVASAVSIGADNMALGLASVAFSEILGSTTCIFTSITVVLMGLPFNKWLILPTIAVAMGCAISTAGEIHASVPGILLVFLSNAFRAIKASLQQKLMTEETKERFDPCSLLMWVSVPSALLMFTSSIVFDGTAPIRQMAVLDPATLRGLLVAIGVSCANAAALNLAQLFVTKSLGAVGAQLVGQAKAVLTVLGGVALFGEQVTPTEVVGFAEVLFGVYAFSAMDDRARAAREAKKRQA